VVVVVVGKGGKRGRQRKRRTTDTGQRKRVNEVKESKFGTERAEIKMERGRKKERKRDSERK